MPNFFSSFDPLLFAALPYAVFLNFFIFTIHRYRSEAFTYSSLSSQFLENRQHFWGVAPFHFGIIVVLSGHFIAFLIPREVLLWNSQPLRLYVLEVSALVAGLLTLVGYLGAATRRFADAKVRQVTSKLDWILTAVLLVQIVSGVYIAVFNPWGSSWFAASMSPYLWSLLQFHPDVTYLATMPLALRLHLLGFYALIGIFPFTRLVHILVVPNPYLWRKPQVVRWYGRPKEALK